MIAITRSVSMVNHWSYSNEISYYRNRTGWLQQHKDIGMWSVAVVAAQRGRFNVADSLCSCVQIITVKSLDVVLGHSLEWFLVLRGVTCAVAFFQGIISKLCSNILTVKNQYNGLLLMNKTFYDTFRYILAETWIYLFLLYVIVTLQISLLFLSNAI